MTATNGTTEVGERRRLSVATVLVALALAGVASVLIHPAGAHPPSPSLAAAADGLPGARSTAWFCAGPLPVGTPGEASSIAIANGDTSPVAATVTIVAAEG
ncbi:MAG: hypothetical protein WAL35_01340, partial [Acidimicrobiales bacterium]